MSTKNTTMMTSSRHGASGYHTAFELSSPPMIGLLPATTVVYILLGMGALLPVLLLTVIAVTLCVRKRTVTPPPAVIPVDLACHTNSFGFNVDLTDIGDDDVFRSKNWKRKPIWDSIRKTYSDFSNEYRNKRIAKIRSGKMEVISVNNPNVYFRNGRPPKLGDAEVKKSEATIETEDGVPPKDIVENEEVFSLNNNDRKCSDQPSCDVILTSSSDSGSDVVSIGPTTAGHVQESTGSTLDSAHKVETSCTSLDRVQSTTRSILQQEEERVLRLLDEMNCTLETDLVSTVQRCTNQPDVGVQIASIVTHL